MDYFLGTVRKSILRRFISSKSDKFELQFFLREIKILTYFWPNLENIENVWFSEIFKGLRQEAVA